MTARDCPWCGKKNLRIVNVYGTNQTIYWHDSACGYREVTTYGPEYRVLKTTPPVPPLPCHAHERKRNVVRDQMNLGGYDVPPRS